MDVSIKPGAVHWATDALDVVRRDVWNAERGGKGRSTRGSKSLKKAGFALWKNPEDLTAGQRAQLALIAKAHPTLHRAYLLKEGLRVALKQGENIADALRDWVTWARRCRLGAVKPHNHAPTDPTGGPFLSSGGPPFTRATASAQSAGVYIGTAN